MSNRCRVLLLVFFLSGFLISFNNKALAGVPVISEVNVTDVTPVSFSAVWLVNELSNTTLEVYNHPDCITPASGITVNVISNATTGINKATVTGLTASTAYCYQINAISQITPPDSAVYPNSPAVINTETEVSRVYSSGGSLLPFANDIILYPSYQPDLVTPADGALLVLSVPGGSSPVSAFIGDGIASPLSLADMNNLFANIDHRTLNLSGGEVLTIREIRGNLGGTLYHYRFIPQDDNLAEVKAPVACFFADNDCSNRVDIFDAQRCFNQFGKQAGAWEYNDDLDVEDNNRVDIFDCQRIFNRFGQTAPFVP